MRKKGDPYDGLHRHRRAIAKISELTGIPITQFNEAYRGERVTTVQVHYNVFFEYVARHKPERIKGSGTASMRDDPAVAVSVALNEEYVLQTQCSAYIFSNHPEYQFNERTLEYVRESQASS